MAARATFIWGLKRSGIHLVANWLYRNHGAIAKSELSTQGLHRTLVDGFADPCASVAFYNNCGRFHCRQFELGDLTPADFEQAARRYTTSIFGIEDCSLRFAPRTAGVSASANVMVLRDPLNNLASRLEAGTDRPELFRVDEAYLDLFETYCAEYLGHTNHLGDKTVINYDRFIQDRAYRDVLAADLGLENLDVVSEVSDYGGGSSFSGTGSPSSTSSLMTRYHQHPIPHHLVEMLLNRPALQEACLTVFGYELSERAGSNG